MNTTLNLLTLGSLTFLLVLAFTPFIKKIAFKIKLVDKPNYRKVHQEPIPLIGGIIITFSVFLSILIHAKSAQLFSHYQSILSTSFILLLIGIVDDKKDIKAKHKLYLQLLLAFIIAYSGIRITSLYGIFGITEINIWLQYSLTIVVITGVVNAFNLMDGVDGLAGGLSLLGFIMLFFAAQLNNNSMLSHLCITLIGGILGFLKFNLSKNKIFMGDSGSLFLGFLLVTLGIQFMEEKNVQNLSNSIYVFLILVAFFVIPVLDSIRVYLLRIKNGNSPFKADKSHLHHLLLQVGLNHKKISLCIVMFALALSFMSMTMAPYLPVTISVFCLITFFLVTIKILLMINQLFQWKNMLQVMEQN